MNYPSPVTRIEVCVLDPVPLPDRSLAASIRGAKQAVAGCGHWPAFASLEQYAAAVDRAGREVSRLAAIEARYRRRFGRPVGLTLERLAARRSVAMALLDQRCSNLTALIGPAEGSA
jgi:hypothetical protein